MEKEGVKVTRIKLILFSLASFEKLFLLSFFLFSFFALSDMGAIAGVGEDNVTTITNLTVGASEPVIDLVEVFPLSIDLVPNSTVRVNCSAFITNDAGDTEIQSVDAALFDVSVSSYGGVEDNNSHYTNSSCEIDTSYGDSYQAVANCSFNLMYNANPGSWNCTVNVTNNYFPAQSSNSTYVNPLLAFGLPNVIDYGVVNVTEVSLENVTNVTNYGNTQVNLSLSGYAQTEGDGYSMNCSLGASPFIQIEHEKYNLTNSTLGSLTLAQAEATYINLTSGPVVKQFELNYHQTEGPNDAVNSTYWRIYVPKGVAGTCNGRIIFGAVVAPGT